MLLALAMRRGVRAFRAKQVTAAQRDRHQHTIALEAHRANPHPRQINQTTECSRDAHGQRPPTRGLEHHRAYGLTRARLPSPPAAPASRPRAEQDTGALTGADRGSASAQRRTANGRRQAANRSKSPSSSGSRPRQGDQPAGRSGRPSGESPHLEHRRVSASWRRCARARRGLGYGAEVTPGGRIERTVKACYRGKGGDQSVLVCVAR